MKYIISMPYWWYPGTRSSCPCGDSIDCHSECILFNAGECALDSAVLIEEREPIYKKVKKQILEDLNGQSKRD